MNGYFSDDFNKQPDATFGMEEAVKDVPQLVRSKESGDKIYFTRDGFKHWITSGEVLKALGFDFGKEIVIDKLVMNQLKSGEPIRMENVMQFTTFVEAEAVKALPLDEPAFVEGEVVMPAHKDPNVIDRPVVPGLTSIIIPAFWNSYQVFHLTGDCIGAIREHTDKLKTPYEIILVINGKTGIGFKEDELNKTYADKIIQNPENMGYGYAINQGIRISQGEYIVLMNDDVKVFDNWLEDLQFPLTEIDLVMSTPMYGLPFARAVEAAELREKYSSLELSDFTDFSCVITRREVFDKIGLFDEQFFLYASDVDLLKRMTNAGMKYASTKRVNIHHIISATDIPGKAELMDKEKEQFRVKWEQYEKDKTNTE